MPPVALPAPPVPEEPADTSSPWVSAVPMLGSVGSIALLASANGSGGRGWLAGGSFLVATVAFVLVQLDRQRSQRRRHRDGLRRDYLRALDAVRRDLGAPTTTVGVRWGWGPVPREIALPDVARDADPACTAAMHRLAAAHRAADGPLMIELGTSWALPDGEEGRAIARAVVRAAAQTHGSGELAVAVVTGDRPAWEWLAWVPHCATGTARDALGPRRLVVSTYDELARLAPDDRHLLVVDETGHPPPGSTGRTLLALDGVGERRLDPALADRLSEPEAAAWARSLPAPSTARSHDLADLLGVDPGSWLGWQPRHDADVLRVPIGVDIDGEPVLLDLKESARGGVGPHGLVVGATGSGKSELLRTLVTGLVLGHSPDDLNLVLVDFKGGATFAGLGGLPHVSAVITNLADDLTLVDRMHDALTGELTRRQEVLRAAGVATAHQVADLPSLLVVVDEFSELLAARPEFGDLFVTLGRLGRSLGIHLLLASQRLEEGRLRGLESHLSWRVGLRTFSAAESRAAIGVPDAHALPARPGVGYLRTGPDGLVRFTAAHAGASVRRPDRRVLPVTTGHVPPVEQAGSAFLDLAVDAVARTPCAPAHRIWLPPLAAPPRLADLPDHVVGVVDRPREQRHDPLPLDLGGAGGHVAVVGGPRSGKSTLVQTLVCTLARRLAPTDLRVHLLDLGDSLGDLDALPHVASRATRHDPDLVRRVVGAAVRALDETGPRTLLVVDGWASFRTEYGDLEAAVTDLASRGLASGVHLVVTSPRWAEVRPALRDLLGTRFELRLGDPLDSWVDRRLAAAVPANPGRGLTATGHHFLAALPDPTDVAARWPGPAPHRLRPLPSHLWLHELGGTGTRIGLGEHGPTTLDDHLVVLGDPGSGRTTTLRTLASQHVGQVVLVDPRRSLLDAIEPERLLHHLALPTAIRDGLAGLASYLTTRLPGPDVTAQQVRARSWWSGAEVLVVVDDHDLTALGGDPLEPLLPLLPHGADIGLRVVVARRAAGAARAMHEPVLRTLRDVGAAGLLLSATSDEGPLLGVRPTRQPPGRGHLVTRAGTGLVQVAVTSSGAP